MSDSWQDSVVLITSSDPSESHFGTGFVIDKDEQTTFLLTCIHVVRDVGGPEKIEIDGTQARVIASSPEEGADLAVLCVERLLDIPPLSLYVTTEEGKSFSTAGFQLDGKQFVIRELHGNLGEQVGVQMRGQADRLRAWDLVITDNYLLQGGYSGSPVVDEYSNVIAFVNTRRGEGKTGVAISIETLKKVWPGMPRDLFVQIENKPDPPRPAGVKENSPMEAQTQSTQAQTMGLRSANIQSLHPNNIPVQTLPPLPKRHVKTGLIIGAAVLVVALASISIFASFARFTNNMSSGKLSPSPDPNVQAVITEFVVPTSGVIPYEITAGHDGNLWFTELDGNQIGRISPAGSISEFPIPTRDSLPFGIALGLDHQLWFAEEIGNRIGRIIVPT